mmetsp:Transcript_32948/g.43409  ORF Transcript_32948/g.43409 Transcript_32948/m.43409 type:complete len:184 (+) Transcript_32948:588-1139(+)
MTDKQKVEYDRKNSKPRAEWRTKMIELWYRFNPNLDGYLEEHEAREFFNEVGATWPVLNFPQNDEGFQQMMREIDDNFSGLISKKEFERWFMNKGLEINYNMGEAVPLKLKKLPLWGNPTEGKFDFEWPTADMMTNEITPQTHMTSMTIKTEKGSFPIASVQCKLSNDMESPEYTVGDPIIEA